MKKYLKPLFIVYGLIMLWLLFGQRLHSIDFTDYAGRLSRNINLVPFRTVKLFIRLAKYSTDSASLALAVRNLAGNIVLFIPLGFLPAIFPQLKSFVRFIITVSLCIAAVEILQFVTLLGSCDIDDLILNVSGAVIGFVLMGLFEKSFAEKI